MLSVTLELSGYVSAVRFGQCCQITSVLSVTLELSGYVNAVRLV